MSIDRFDLWLFKLWFKRYKDKIPQNRKEKDIYIYIIGPTKSARVQSISFLYFMVIFCTPKFNTDPSVAYIQCINPLIKIKSRDLSNWEHLDLIWANHFIWGLLLLSLSNSKHGGKQNNWFYIEMPLSITNHGYFLKIIITYLIL